MAEIYAESGGNGSAIPEALLRIKNELGIVLGKDGRSLRDWQKKYGIYPKPVSAPGLFQDDESSGSRGPIVVIPRRIPFREFQSNMETYAGQDQQRDRSLLDTVYQALREDRIRECLNTKTPEELLKIKQMIEEGQQKRELHLVKMIEFVDYMTRSPGMDKDAIDGKLLEELNHGKTQIPG